MPTEDKFFTLNELSEYLKISKSTLYKLSEKGQIPSSKIGKQLRFRKSSLDKWFTEKETKHKAQAPDSFPLIDSKEGVEQLAKRVLLIDDDTLVLKSVGKFLENQGYAVVASASGEQALSEAKKANFDLLIADIRMPGMDGLEAIQQIRELNSQNQRPAIPEIIITGYIDPQAQEQALQLGIRDYLYKPFALTEFIQAVKERIGFNSGLN